MSALFFWSAAFCALGSLAIYFFRSLTNIILRPDVLAIANYPEMFGLKGVDVEFRSSDGALLRGWWVGAPSGPAGKTIICCHGWGTNRGDILAQSWYLAYEGFNLFYFDFRGCGESPRFGPSSLGFFETRDLAGALDFVKGHYPLGSRGIGLYGLSMGGAASIALSGAPQARWVRAVLAEAPFWSFKEVVRRYMQSHYAVGWFPIDFLFVLGLRWRCGWADHQGASPIKTMERFNGHSLLLIYGDRDCLAWPEDGERILRQAQSRPLAEAARIWIVAGAGHAECFSKDPALYRQKAVSFFKKALS